MEVTGKSGYPYSYWSVTLEMFDSNDFRTDFCERPEGGSLMFDHHCTACDKTQLIFPSQVTSLVNTEHGIIVAFECWCGAEQTMLTGARVDHRETVAA
jgi:hypothetical protein